MENYCPKCGYKKRSKNQNFCIHCGYKFVKDTFVDPTSMDLTPNNAIPRKRQKSKWIWFNLGLFVLVSVAMITINVKYKQYRQAKVNNNPLSSQKIVFERFGANDIDISNATYDHLIERIDFIMAQNDQFNNTDIKKILNYRFFENRSKASLEDELGVNEYKINKLLSDMDIVDNQENLIKIQPRSKLKRGKSVMISLNLPKRIIRRYRIETTSRNVTIPKIINGKKVNYERIYVDGEK